MADDDPPLQPLQVPVTAIPDPLRPAPVPAGQIPSLVPTGGRPYQPMDLSRQIANSVAGSSIADQMVQDFVRKQNLTPTTRYDFVGPELEKYRTQTALTPIAQSFRGESFDPGFRGTAGELKPDVAGVPDFLRQAERGFLAGWNETLLGTAANRLMSYGTLYKAAQETNDPNYDPFNDQQIKVAGLDNQMHMFATSGSAAQTKLVIGYYQKRQQETAWLDRSSGIVGWTGGAAEFAGSAIGDPTNLIPGSLGVKGLALTVRGAKGLMTGGEFSLLAGRKAVYGSIADGLRPLAINAAAMIASQALIHSIDPTLPGDVSADIILPSVIAGSLGLYNGIAARRIARKLAEEVRQQDFLKPANAPRYGAPDQPGGIRHEPSGDFPASSLATDYGNVRRSEMAGDPYTNSVSPGPGKPGWIHQTEQDIIRNADRALANVFIAGKASDEVINLAGRRAVEDYGLRELPHGNRTVSASMLPVGQKVSMTDGTVWEVQSVKMAEGLHEKQFKAIRATPLTEMTFKPGMLEAVQLTAKEVQDMNLGDRAGYGPHAFVRGAATVEEGATTMPNGAGVVRAADFGTGQRLIDDANREWVVLPTGANGLKQFHKTGETYQVPGLSSVGAAQNPASQIHQRQVLLDQGRMAPSGLGIENWGLTPTTRIFRGESVAAMNVTTDLVSTSGLQSKGNQLGIANVGQPVETLIAVNWNRPMVLVQRATQDAWTDYRRALANASQPAPPSVAGRSDSARVASQVGMAIKDAIHSGEKGLSLAQFKERVGQALRQGDVDQLGDSASSYVARAAAEHRKLYNLTKEKAIELGMFDEAYNEAIDAAQSGIKALKKEADATKIRAHKEKWSPTQLREAEEALLVRMEDAQYKFKQAQNKLDELRANGPLLNGTAPSYAPRIYRVDKLLDGEEAFVTRISDWLQSRHASNGGQLAQEDAVRLAKQIHTLLSKQTPIYERADQKALFKGVSNPASVQARSLNIPDELISEFLEHDAEVLMRHHVKQMGTAIEMQTKFGSLDLADEVAEIEQEYRKLIIEANKGATEPTERAKELTAMMKGAISDVQALRDRLYGTYGASPDPQRWQSRSIRLAKQFSNLTLMGMSGITALGDLVRPLVTEGFDSFFGYGFRSLMSDQRALILRLNREELELAGNGMELMLNTRALSFADNGDIFAGRTAFERGMNQANSWMFVANGLNHVNQMDKEWASLIIGGKFNSALLDLQAGAGDSFRSNLGRYAAVGIDEELGRRIGLQLKIHAHEFGSGGKALIIANSEAWTDDLAKQAYRGAMNQMTNRTVPTPGVGDTPLWMSTELGGLLTQYKSFAFGAMNRVLLSGLQENGMKFWYGAGAMVGFAALLNEVRSQLFYGKSTTDKPVPAIIADAVDRSSILGWFGDVDRAVTMLSGNSVGIKPMMGAASPVQPRFSQVAGAVGGPSAGQAARLLNVANDALSLHPTAQTYRDWRTLIPGQNLPYADPVMSMLFDKDGLLPSALGVNKQDRRNPAGFR